jgi:alpha-mannosidase
MSSSKWYKASGFKFLVEQTFLLEQIEHRNPQLFAEIQDAIAAGKMEIVDGQYLMPDPMILWRGTNTGDPLW